MDAQEWRVEQKDQICGGGIKEGLHGGRSKTKRHLRGHMGT